MVAKRAYAIRPYISRPMWWRYVQNANGSTGSDRLTAMDKPGHVPTSVSAAARLTDSLRSTTQWVVNVNVAHARARKPSSCPVIPRPEGTRQRRISSRFDVAQAGEISRVRARNDSAHGTLPNRQVSDDDPLNDVNEPFPPSPNLSLACSPSTAQAISHLQQCRGDAHAGHADVAIHQCDAGESFALGQTAIRANRIAGATPSVTGNWSG